MNTTHNSRFESHIHPVMNPFLTVLANTLEKLQNDSPHSNLGFAFCYFNHDKNILVTEEYGHIKIDQKLFHIHTATMKVTRTFCANKTKSSQVFDPTSQQLLEVGAIRIGKDYAGGSGNGIMSDPLICEAASALWLIAKDLYHKGGSRASQESSFWTKILREAKNVQEENSPENGFISQIAEAIIKFRGTLRKFALQQQINILVENATDKENVVRFAILVDYDSLKNIEMIGVFLKEKFEEKVKILSLKDFRFVENPVLSKLSVNDSSRY